MFSRLELSFSLSMNWALIRDVEAGVAGEINARLRGDTSYVVGRYWTVDSNSALYFYDMRFVRAAAPVENLISNAAFNTVFLLFNFIPNSNICTS